jgi:hypothetical protein
MGKGNGRRKYFDEAKGHIQQAVSAFIINWKCLAL